MQFKTLVPTLILTSFTFGHTQEQSDSWKGSPTANLRLEASYDEAKDSSQGKINRAFLGYKASYGQKVEAAIVYDATPAPKDAKGNPMGYSGVLQNAYLNLRSILPGGDLIMGLQNTPGYQIPKEIWNMHYIRSPLMIQYGGASNADLGIVLDKKCSLTDQLKLQIGVFQGDGYKKLNSDLERERYMASAFWKQGETGLQASLYGEWRPYRQHDNKEVEALQSMHAGYVSNSLRTGIEAILQQNAGGIDADSTQKIAMAINLHVLPIKSWEIFVRGEYAQTDLDGNSKQNISTGIQKQVASKSRIASVYKWDYSEKTDKSFATIGLFGELIF